MDCTVCWPPFSPSVSPRAIGLGPQAGLPVDPFFRPPPFSFLPGLHISRGCRATNFSGKAHRHVTWEKMTSHSLTGSTLFSFFLGGVSRVVGRRMATLGGRSVIDNSPRRDPFLFLFFLTPTQSRRKKLHDLCVQVIPVGFFFLEWCI